MDSPHYPNSPLGEDALGAEYSDEAADISLNDTLDIRIASIFAAACICSLPPLFISVRRLASQILISHDISHYLAL